MKERLKEMRQWWDEVMKDDEEENVREDEKVLPQVCVCLASSS